ncbi:homoserine kinase [Helicobacter jaachi]|uniref:Homoserine kinase n=1 Tax=Helicobacter jaachi TaxID=1677920 RepID=A0A4U8T9I5_9HELI|nr:homoserine kinase [Helicobacter jaachi]TLD96313.1 homoserine kinase [Helicobacter jaachi]
MVISVPATSANLGPGFDTLGLALGLYNTFSITPARLSSIHISGEGKERVKLRVDNVFVKIFNDILALHEYPKDNFKFSFHNCIPISRGLGSSSAVIIGAIMSAYHIMQKPINKQEMLNLALHYENHPDNITPALYGGFNIAMLEHTESRTNAKKIPEKNTQVVSFQASLPPEIKAVVVIPNMTISTRYSRRTLPKKYSTKDAVFNLSHACMLSAAFITQKWDLLRAASADRFHQDVRMKSLPVLFNVRKIALEHGALLSTLSGSGSSFLNICYKDDSANLALKLRDEFPKFRVLELDFDNMGACLREL